MMNDSVNVKSTPLSESAVLNTISADNASRLPKYDFMTAKEVGAYLGIGKSQAYEICKMINAKLAAEGFLTFRGKVPRQALMDQLPRQGGGNE